MKQVQKSLASCGFTFQMNAAVKKNVILPGQYVCSLPALFQFAMSPDIRVLFQRIAVYVVFNALYLK